MVGLPARGKTFIAQKVGRYLQWVGVNTRVFNVGEYRREQCGAHQLHNFFDPENPEGKRKRQEAASAAMDDLLHWITNEEGTAVAIYDATNSTQERRRWILERCRTYQARAQLQVMFIESVCEDEEVVMENIRAVKLQSPDYAGVDPEAAARDFRERIRHYESSYEPVQERDLTYIRLVNVRSQVVVNLIRGYLQSRVVYYLMNLHVSRRCIFFSRHGESMFNVEGKIGGDSLLSPRGEQYANALPQLIKDNLGSENLTVWTSTMRRTIQTASKLPYPKLQWKALDELNAGEKYPEDYANRDDDKFNYRYRGGESYRDVVLRLEPVMMELERQHNILIIGHQAILRCIYAYFMNLPRDELPYIRVPLHTVIRLAPKAYGCEETRFRVNIEAVDTHRPKPQAG
ncbi:6-phosphofructo-2-kinase-domain-containing protein [Thamnocephalis sphaerospora]|uniref:fructose-2,6-bisphosphate 2-phosphatase n=1 Tax=Thamnocephalis sphaerospora TaxID=78915 RepID=A0A4P9XRC2_9FUNG|nr:6-phosphofructo-2-kinase-domain-containing protein [Thamnocephalis sphaerospora]|eukprot:RKP08626.1 6-phosphofructo-2-kinase-domain-containing protein [Thamnocephalis sphaerospora]